MRQGGKVKHPCKICLKNVSKRKGLQCQGACKSWVHYSCLNYTPGKVKDIKAGIIKVTCPCPDCKSVSPREYRIDEPCTDVMCPVHQIPFNCESNTCPVNYKTMKPPIGSTRDVRCGQSCEDVCTPDDQCCVSCEDIPGDFGQGACPTVSFNTLEQMCNTIGQLTDQINTLMTKMRDSGAKHVQAKIPSSPEQKVLIIRDK